MIKKVKLFQIRPYNTPIGVIDFVLKREIVSFAEIIFNNKNNMCMKKKVYVKKLKLEKEMIGKLSELQVVKGGGDTIIKESQYENCTDSVSCQSRIHINCR